MLIRELEQKTGLERATIRYYEKEGFIAPHREENGYRTYTEADRDMLLKIKLLRQLGMPLEKIKALQQGSVDFSEALAEQIHALEKQVQDANRAKEVCIDIRNTGTTFGELNAEYYLVELTRAARADAKWKPQPVPEFSPATPVHPWRRYLARCVDLSILEMSVLFLVAVIFRVRPMNDLLYSVIGISIVMHLMWIPIEGFLLHRWGTTPGKWIFGIRVESANGGHLSASDAMHRAWDILRYGYGFTIPIYSYWRLYKSYKQYNDYGFSQWDKNWDAEIQFDYLYDTRKKIGIGCMIAAYLLVCGFYLNDAIKPKHRGEDLTVAQIAEIHNDLVDQIYENSNLTMYLNDDGSWMYNQSSAVVVIGSQTVDGNRDYQYELENGFVRSITYEQTWTEIFYLSPVGARPICTTKAIALAQDWLNIWNASEFEDELNAALKEPSGQFIHENLEIRWTTTSENCIYQGGYYRAENEDQPSFVTLKFEILIYDIP